MPNITKFLTSEAHLVPLLQWYIRQIESGGILRQPVEDCGYMNRLDDEIIGMQTKVICEDKAGSEYIAKGYWYALTHALKKKNENHPQTIRIISLINHNELHWTASVAVIALDPKFYQLIKTALHERYRDNGLDNITIDQLKDFISQQFFESDLKNDFKMKGAKSIHIHHYDSHSPNNPTSRYANQYFKTLEALIEGNAKTGIEILVQPKNCKQELGNTCCDYALFNGVMAALGLDVGQTAYQMDSVSLRILSEHILPELRTEHSDKQKALKATQKIEALIAQARIEIEAALKSTQKDLRHGRSFKKK